MLTRYNTFAAFALLLIAADHSLGEVLFSEGYGNDPLPRFEARTAIGEIINDKTRVYNLELEKSNNRFMFRGDMKQLNEALRNFAKIDGEVHEVVLRPGPGIGLSLNRKTRISHNWSLEVPGQNSAVLNKLDLGHLVSSPVPVMTIYIGGDIKLDEIEVPEGIVFTELSDLNVRLREATATSTHNSVRYSGVAQLARLSPYDEDNLIIMARMLDDKEYNIRYIAVRGISAFGAKAKRHLPMLRPYLKSDQAALRSCAADAVEAIEKSTENLTAEKEFFAKKQAIKRFCKMRPKRKTDVKL